jgi:TrmH family RNA methyltransferase
MLVKSQVKYIQSLGQKKYRDAEKLFIAEGPKIVNELLQSGNIKVRQVYGIKEWIDEYVKASPAGVTEFISITENELERISQFTTPNKVLAVAEQAEQPGIIETKNRITLALDMIQDPGNLGTIIRIADWFAVTQVVCSPDCADIYNPKVIQATMGSIARVHVAYKDLTEWIGTLTNTKVYATMLEGQDITEMKKITEGIIIIGNESRGIDQQLYEISNVQITIPRKGHAESLNAAVAAGIVLSHLL